MPLARIANGDIFSAGPGITTFGGTVYPSATRTVTPTDSNGVGTDDKSNNFGNSIIVFIDVTSINAGTPSVVFTVEGKDPVSGKYYTLLASAAIVAVGTTVLRVNPGLTAAANTIAKDMLPSLWRVKAVHADGQAITYSVGAVVTAA